MFFEIVVLLFLVISTEIYSFVPFNKYNVVKNRSVSSKQAKKTKPIFSPISEEILIKENDNKINLNIDDDALYKILLGIQVFPALTFLDITSELNDLSIRKIIGYLYFLSTASLSVYLGSKRQDIPIKFRNKPITQKSALLAPFLSGGVLLSIYAVIKYLSSFELIFEKGYQLLAVILSVFCMDTVLSDVVYKEVDENGIPLPQEEPNSSQLGLTIGTFIGLSYLLFNYLPVPDLGLVNDIEKYYAIAPLNNLCAIGIAILSIGQVQIESFTVAALLLGGLFFYDIFFVFGVDVMVTVATKIEAPVKLLVPASTEKILSRPYPFSVLGLGDLVVPGIMVGLARGIDRQKEIIAAELLNLQNKNKNKKTGNEVTSFFSTLSFLNKKGKNNVFNSSDVDNGNSSGSTKGQIEEGKISYLSSALTGYIFGLFCAFTANEVTKAGQPALLYLSPSVTLSMLYAAYINGEIAELLNGTLETSAKRKEETD